MTWRHRDRRFIPWGQLVRWQALLVISLAGCRGGGASKPPEQPSKPVHDAGAPAPMSGKVTIICEPSGAQVVVDGVRRGTVAELNQQGGLLLPFGLHRFEIRMEGHRAFRLELNLGQRPEVLRVKLQPRE